MDFTDRCRTVRSGLGDRPQVHPGFTKLWPSVGTLAAMVVSVYLLALALKSIPVGTGYAVWTGVGAVGTAILGIVLFGEAAGMARLACIGLIIGGIAGLKLAG